MSDAPPGRPSAGDDGDQRVSRLEAEVERLERSLDHSRELLHEAEITNRSLARELEAVREAAKRISRRRAVRLSLAVANRFRPAIRLLRSGVRLPAGASRRVAAALHSPRRASRAAEAGLTARIVAASGPPAVAPDRLVSIVILNRDGRPHLERCLAAVGRTAYRNLEVIVVDNGSADGSAELVEGLKLPFPVSLIRNAENRSFSEANGQGVARATGDLLLFLNNDIEPITEHWLGYLVETLTKTGAAAVGARLIYPRNRGGPRAAKHWADLTVQHAGVEFDRSEPIPRPRVMGGGEDPMAALATEVAERPALTAACLLVERAAFEAVGGFDRAYDYGIEDIDLCLKLRVAGKRLVYDGRTALWHHESATRIADRAAYAARVAANREVFVRTWGPSLFRAALLDGIDAGGELSSKPFHVGITVTSLDPDAGAGDLYTARELGEALERLGWRVSYLEAAGDAWYAPDPSLEAVIVLLDRCDLRRLPRRLISIAWIRNWPDRWLARPWFDDFDLVFASSGPIADLVRERSAKVATVLPIATNQHRFSSASPDPDMACDVLFVGNYWHQQRDVVDALPELARRGYSVRVYGRGWETVPGFADLHRGFLPYEEVPRAYASARIVVDDAAGPTRARGSVNSRVFDAIAAGALVVSSGTVGVADVFGADFPTWSDPASLGSVVEASLGDGDAAAAVAERMARFRTVVLAEHTYDVRAGTIREALRGWVTAARVAIRVGIPDWEVAPTWGDYHFARAVQRGFERSGHAVRVQILPDWTTELAAREDITLHVLGRREAPTHPAQVNLLWHISHPDETSPLAYERYDHAFVASDGYAERMGPIVHVPVSPLHQATDPERFRPDLVGPHHELLLVANSRRVRRRIVDDLAGTPFDLAVYGTGWAPELLDPRHLRGEHIPNEDLARFYASADIVLNDHWEDMRQHGFISNRIYDALASGAFVLSDAVPGIEAEFDGAVATYERRDELAPLISRYLADPGERRRLAATG
ncbi:MAG TPA: glycosyltransferase, partial [Candidatus Limnocylindrales bacterium]|nr:glycosyltransferase [Candidatus Limnocylindrales bacterium]